MYPKLPIHKVARLTATGLVFTGAALVYGLIVIGGTAVSTVALFSSVDGSGTALLNGSAPIGDSSVIDLSMLGPIPFATHLYATIAGTGAIIFVVYD